MSAILRLRSVVERFKRFEAAVSSARETKIVGKIFLAFSVLASPGTVSRGPRQEACYA
jgi:hypothetical protein